MNLFRRPSNLFLLVLALLAVPFAAATWEADPSSDVEERLEAREAFASRQPTAPSALAAPTVPTQAILAPLPAAAPIASPPVRTSVRLLTGRLNQ